MAPEKQASADRAAQLGRWVEARLRELLDARPDTADYRVYALWPAVAAWYAEAAPGVARAGDLFTLEVSFQSGTDDDTYAVDPPAGLAEDSPWFSLAFLRIPSADGGFQASAGLVLWFAPAPRLMAFVDDPTWDTGNALGFDCLGDAGPEAREWVKQPAVTEIIEAFADLQPAAVELIVSGTDDDIRLV